MTECPRCASPLLIETMLMGPPAMTCFVCGHENRDEDTMEAAHREMAEIDSHRKGWRKPSHASQNLG